MPHDWCPKHAPTAATNATIADRAGAWADVEAEQRRVNAAAQDEHELAEHVEALRQAWQAFSEVPLATESAAGSIAWKRIMLAQTILNQAARIAHLPAVAILDAALDRYVGIGGASDRKPADGGLA